MAKKTWDLAKAVRVQKVRSYDKKFNMFIYLPRKMCRAMELQQGDKLVGQFRKKELESSVGDGTLKNLQVCELNGSEIKFLQVYEELAARGDLSLEYFLKQSYGEFSERRVNRMIELIQEDKIGWGRKQKRIAAAVPTEVSKEVVPDGG
mgnify:CR=1 FL=1